MILSHTVLILSEFEHLQENGGIFAFETIRVWQVNTRSFCARSLYPSRKKNISPPPFLNTCLGILAWLRDLRGLLNFKNVLSRNFQTRQKKCTIILSYTTAFFLHTTSKKVAMFGFCGLTSSSSATFMCNVWKIFIFTTCNVCKLNYFRQNFLQRHIFSKERDLPCRCLMRRDVRVATGVNMAGFLHLQHETKHLLPGRHFFCLWEHAFCIIL